MHAYKWPGQVRWDIEDPRNVLQGHTDKTAIAEFLKQKFIGTGIGTGREEVQIVKAYRWNYMIHVVTRTRDAQHIRQ